MNPYTLVVDAGRVRLTLTGEITIEHAAALHGSLRLALADRRPVDLDAAATVRFDTAAVQLLLAAARAASEARAVNASVAWAAACARFGVSSPFLPAANPEPSHD